MTTKLPNQISGAEAIVHCLLAEGVNLIYGYPGGAIMPFYDELYKFQDRLRHVLVRHEQGAAHAAQGYARATGKVGVAVATSGPGATNLVTGIADAQIDSTPLVCITGQVGRHLLGSDAFQETDIIGISTPITKWNYQITKAAEIPYILAKAFYIARSGRPGPVLVDITKNAQFELFEFEYTPCDHVRSYLPEPQIDMECIHQAASLINEAKKPMIVYGQGVVLGNAEQELKTFIEKTTIPAAWTILGKSALPTAHRHNVGMVGMHGNYAPNVLTNECDVLIAIGMRFDDRVTGDLNTYAKQAKIIHFDIDKAEINKNVKVDVGVLGNCKQTLAALLPLVQENNHSQWQSSFDQLYEVEFKEVIDKEMNPTGPGISMAEVIEQINVATQSQAIVVTDVGQHQMIACRYAQETLPKSTITSGGLGTMGFALPSAIGAKMGAPEREVITVIGDGGFQMNIQELQTVFSYNLPITVFIQNNFGYGIIKQFQDAYFDSRYYATGEGYTMPNFEFVISAYKIPYFSFKSEKDFKSFSIPSGFSVIDLHFPTNSLITPKTEMNRFIHD